MEIWGEGLVGSEKWTREQTHNGHIKTESFFKCVHLACFFSRKMAVVTLLHNRKCLVR